MGSCQDAFPRSEAIEPEVGTELAGTVTRLRAAGCVFAEEEARLLVAAAQTSGDLSALVERRAAGLPLEQVLGWAEFCGLRIAVEPEVFVPRRRTELLVRQAAPLVQRAAAQRPDRGASSALPVLVDLCCGSGAVGAALAAAGMVEWYAVDIDPAAVHCARRNAAATGGRVYEGDLYDPLPSTLRGRVDVLVANAPYVPTEALGLMPAEARLYEPRVALDGGEDGLETQRRVTSAAPRWLAPGGHLLVETSASQAQATVEIFTRSGLVAQVASSEALDATVVIGSLNR
ncbi:MAG: putative protein N(5)-glutamine methyltransferase [Nocardioidaceae bacterium]